jgi:hypothetical protein
MKMKNFEKIKEIWELFNNKDICCVKELDRLRNNFEIDDDEWHFTLTADIVSPMKDLAEKLIAECMSELVGDEEFVESKGYEKDEIKVSILAESQWAKACLNYRLDEYGDVAAVVCRSANVDMRRYVRKVIDNWLNEEFGNLNLGEPHA